MYYSESGDEQKRFNTRDGVGFAMLKEAGLEVAIITGEDTRIVERMAAKLKVDHVFQGVKDKKLVAESLLQELGLSWTQFAYIGDDINDLSVMHAAGFTATVSDGMGKLKIVADYVCKLPGGGGAFREFAELILKSIDRNLVGGEP